jgi:hypothetical protein
LSVGEFQKTGMKHLNVRRCGGFLERGPQKQGLSNGDNHPIANAPALDLHQQKMTELADRVFCVYSEQARGRAAKAEAKMPEAQATLEAYS